MKIQNTENTDYVLDNANCLAQNDIANIQAAIFEQLVIFNQNFKQFAVITDDDSVPTALEKIVHTLEDIKEEIRDLRESYENS